MTILVKPKPFAVDHLIFTPECWEQYPDSIDMRFDCKAINKSIWFFSVPLQVPWSEFEAFARKVTREDLIAKGFIEQRKEAPWTEK